MDKDKRAYLEWQLALYLEDVAEKPERLKRAQELMREAVARALEETPK